jgi:hypothetical protein
MGTPEARYPVYARQHMRVPYTQLLLAPFNAILLFFRVLKFVACNLFGLSVADIAPGGHGIRTTEPEKATA